MQAPASSTRPANGSQLETDKRFSFMRMLSFRHPSPGASKSEISEIASEALRNGSSSNHERKPGSDITPQKPPEPPVLRANENPLRQGQTLHSPAFIRDMTHFSQNGFATLTEQLVIEMTPAERQALKMELKSARATLEGQQFPQIISQDTLNIIRIWQEKLSVIRHQARYRRLIEIIENSDNLRILQVALCLTNQSVIPTKKLFKMIRKKLKEPLTPPQLLAHLQFCKGWLTHNRKTTLFEEATEHVETIFARIETHPDAAIQALIKEIKELNGAAPASLPNTIQYQAKSVFKTHLEKYLKDGKGSCTNTIVEAIAMDLLHFHWQFLKDIEPDHLVHGKWDKSPPPVARWIEFFNRFNEYIIAQILVESDPKRRLRTFEFFLLLADRCELNRDFVTPFIILSALNNSQIGKLKSTWDSLDQRYKAIFIRLEELYDNRKNFFNLRARLQSVTGDFHIPYHGLCKRDIEAKEQVPKLEIRFDEAYFDEDKLLTIHGIIELFLAVKTMTFPDAARDPTTYQTDLPLMFGV